MVKALKKRHHVDLTLYCQNTGSGENLTGGQRQDDDPLPTNKIYYVTPLLFYKNDMLHFFLKSPTLALLTPIT
jgi:hypothetical protein